MASTSASYVAVYPTATRLSATFGRLSDEAHLEHHAWTCRRRASASWYALPAAELLCPLLSMTSSTDRRRMKKLMSVESRARRFHDACTLEPKRCV
jgi:hypothetical protein